MSILEAALIALVPMMISLRMRLLDWMIDRFGHVKTFAVHVVFWGGVITAMNWPIA